MTERFSGTLYDGQSAAGIPVTVELGPNGIMVQRVRGGIDIWPYASITLMSSHRDGNRIAVSRTGKSAERLTIEGDSVASALAAHAPQHAQTPGRNHGRAVLVSLAIVGTLAAFYFAYPVLKSGLVAVFPDNWAIAWGETVVDAMPGSGETCDDPAGQAVLDQLTAALVASTPLPYEPRVRVDGSKQVNAFAAPGGHVVLLSGMIHDAEGPEEVVGVLAHELGHVKHKHALNRLIDVVGVDIILSSIGGDIGAVGGLVMVLRYGREDEREADRTAVEMLKAAGMPSDGLASFFDRMAAKEGDLAIYSNFLSTHPALLDRSAEVRALGGDHEGAMPISEEQWQSLRWICGDPDADEEAEGDPS
ncbi:MAG: M48 family metallopeptidase [Alphaproteobacteria bacterium]